MSYAGISADPIGGASAVNPQMRNMLLAQMLMRQGQQQPQAGMPNPWTSAAGAGGNIINAMMMQKFLNQPQLPQGGTPQPPSGGFPSQLGSPGFPSSPGGGPVQYSPPPAMPAPGQTMPRPGQPPLGGPSMPGQPFGTGQIY